MGTHIIWRNPSPPRKSEIQVSRIVGNEVAIVYQADGPSGLKHLFELVHTNSGSIAKALSSSKSAAQAPLPGTILVSAPWLGLLP